MFGSGVVRSPLQGRQAFYFRPFSHHQHDWRAAVLVFMQQAPRRVLYLRQRSKISTPLLTTHKLRPAEPSHLLCVAKDVLTDVVQ